MAKVYIVMGSTGSGKSSSTRNLDPKKTLVINVLGKPLPFKGSGSAYSKEKKNHVVTSDYKTVISLLELVGGKGDKEKTALFSQFDNIIIDDARHIMVEEYFKRASENGFSKFVQLAQHFQQVIQAAKDIPGDKNVVFMLHDDDKVSDYSIVEKKPKLVGKLVEEQYNPLEVVTVCLYANCSFDDKGASYYNFVTNRTTINNAVIPAKSPMGMFDDVTIPNDLAQVFKAADEYYK